jgi:serine/threonine protein phosphatase PrpC
MASVGSERDEAPAESTDRTSDGESSWAGAVAWENNDDELSRKMIMQTASAACGNDRRDDVIAIGVDSITVPFTFGAATDPGLVRKHNEDRFCADVDTGLFLVVDGVGGQNAGQVAAQIVRDCVLEFVRETEDDDDKTWPFGIDPALSPAGNRLRAAILVANRNVAQRLEEDEGLTGMAATMAGALIGTTHAVVGNVGDARGYLLRRDKLLQVTLDHSWVAEQVRAGTLDAAAARAHPMRNLVTRAVSGDPQLNIDIVEFEIRSGDVLLLCSDGLHSMVTDEDISRILIASLPDADAASRRLVDTANANGGKDNLPVVIATISSSQ